MEGEVRRLAHQECRGEEDGNVVSVEFLARTTRLVSLPLCTQSPYVPLCSSMSLNAK